MKTASRAKLCLHLIAALLSTSACLTMAADPKASRYYEDALVRFEKNDHKGAIVQLKNALKIDRSMLPVHVLLGRALMANGELNAAEVAFDEALKLGVNPAEVVLPLAQTLSSQAKLEQILLPTRISADGLSPDLRSQVLLIKAAAASDLGKPRDALKFLEDARALDANSANSWAAEVPIRVRARQLPEAKAAADKAVALDPKSSRAAYQQATVAHISGDLETAVKLYTRTLALKPEHVDALVARAGLYIDLNRVPEATADIQAARRADPKDPRSAYMSAMLAERAGNAAEAKKALNEVTNLLDSLPLEYMRYRPQVLMLGGMSHFALDQYEKAKPYLELVVKQDPNSPVSKLLARIYLKENRADKAVESLEAYLRAHPGDTQATMMLASSQMAQGKPGRAAQMLEETLKKDNLPTARALLGMSLASSGKYEPAAAELEATLKQDPTQIQAGITLANLYIASGQGAQAVRVAEGLVRQQPRSAPLATLLANAQVRKGDNKAARAMFQQALAMDPQYGEAQLGLARLDVTERAFDAALERLSTLLTKNDKNIDVLLETARLYSVRGQPEESLRWLQRAEDNSGQLLQPGLMMVDFQLARHRPDLAREAVRRLQGKAPDALPVILALARTHIASGENKEAASALNRASTAASYDAAALTEIASLQVQAENVAGAAHALDKALAAKPTHLRARVMRSNVYLLQGEPAKAEQLARSVLASEPKSGAGHSLLGDIARSRNQMSAATDAYRRAHELDRSTDSLLRLFSALETSPKSAAIPLAEQWVRSKPGDSLVWRALADAQARAGNMPAARAAYESLVKLTPHDADALNNLAIVLVNLSDPSASKIADRALALRPQTPYVIGTAGWAAFHAGQPDRALQLLRDARLRDPGNAGTRYFLGTVLARQGRKPEARVELQEALRSAPDFVYAKETRALLQSLQ